MCGGIGVAETTVGACFWKIFDHLDLSKLEEVNNPILTEKKTVQVGFRVCKSHEEISGRWKWPINDGWSVLAGHGIFVEKNTLQI